MKSLTIAAMNLRRFMRERANIFFVFIFPMLLVLVLGSVFGGGFDTRLGVVALGSGELTSATVESLEARDEFVVQRRDDRDAVIRAVERGELEAALIIPAGYDDAVRTGGAVEIDFVARPGQQASNLRRTIEAVLADRMALPRVAAFVAAEGAGTFDDCARPRRDGGAGRWRSRSRPRSRASPSCSISSGSSTWARNSSWSCSCSSRRWPGRPR